VEENDTNDRQRVAVISESFVRRFWPNETPASVLGRHFNFVLSDRVVAGVVGDVKMRGLEREAEPQVYLPHKQVDDAAIMGYIPRGLIIRSSTPPAAVAPFAREIIRQIDSTLPVSDVNTLIDVVDRDTASRTAQLRVLGAFAVIAFVLAAVGIHGLL